MPDEMLLYRVSWEFSGGAQSIYSVSMKESQARLLAGLLGKYLESGYLNTFDVYSIAPEPLSSRDIMKIIKEEFPRTGKEWMP